MRILYFSKDYCPHDHRFLAALAETNHQVFYLRLERGSRGTEERPVPAKIDQIHWEGGDRKIKVSDGPRLLLGLRRVIKRIKPDIIHAGPIQTVGLLAALSCFRPLLVMSWGFDLMRDVDRGLHWRWATNYVLKQATYFTSDCEATRQKAIRHGVNTNRTVVFPWGVDLGYFTPEPRVTTVGMSKEFTLLCNRSWEPNYGVDVLARAFIRVAHEHKDVNLILLSGGSQEALLRQILTGGGVIDRVLFGGQASFSEIPRYYRKADLFISASHVDGSSVSLMEALACGLPALVSDIPANQEWVTGGKNGWLFPDGDADALATMILEIVANREQLAEVSKTARAVAEVRADWNKNFPKLLQAYELALKMNKEEKRVQEIPESP